MMQKSVVSKFCGNFLPERPLLFNSFLNCFIGVDKLNLLAVRVQVKYDIVE